MADAVTTTAALAAPTEAASASVVESAAPKADAGLLTTAPDAPAESAAATTTEAKPTDKPAEPAKPVEYAEFKAPEGFTLDKALLDAVTPILGKAQVPQEAAQELVNAYAALQSQQAKAEEQAFSERVAEWGKQAKADKEFGGEAFDANMVDARKAVARFASPELKALLTETGLSNHPEVVRLFVKLGKQIAEDSIHTGGTGASSQSTASVLYPSMNS